MMFIPMSCLLLVVEFLRRIVAVWRTQAQAYAVERTREGL